MRILSLSLSICLSLSVRPSVCLSVSLSLSLSPYLCLCLSLAVSLSSSLLLGVRSLHDQGRSGDE